MQQPKKLFSQIPRVVFDTNIYASLAEEKNIREIEQKLVTNAPFIAYGCSLVRKELRNAPQRTKITLLELYDHITKERTLLVTTEAQMLAEEYFREAKKIGKEKIQSWEEYETDFLLIAVATLNNLDLVVSADKRTMLGEYCKEAYAVINLKHKMRSPTFYSYEMLKRAFIPTKTF